MPRAIRTPAKIGADQIERALHQVARLVAAPGGDALVPLFERLERELADRRRATDAVSRARALAAQPSTQGGL